MDLGDKRDCGSSLKITVIRSKVVKIDYQGNSYHSLLGD